MLSLLAVGWALTKTGNMRDEKPIAALLTNAILPAMLIGFLQSPYSPELLRDKGLTMLGFVVVILAGAAVGFILGVLTRQPIAVTGTWTANITTTNAIFMGWPITMAIYGQRAFPLAAGILLVFNLVTFTFGAWLLTVGRGGKGVSIKALLLQPIIIGALVGATLFFMPFRLPGPAIDFLDMLGMMATPLSMIIIGCQLARCSIRDTFLDAKVYLVVAARLIAAPLAAHFLLRLFISDPMILGVLTIVACMPVAASVAVVAADREGDAAFCSKVIFVSTLLCIFTVPVLIPLLI